MEKVTSETPTQERARLSFRVSQEDDAEIRIAARACHLPIGDYLARRVMGQSVLATPGLAALAELIALLKRIEATPACAPDTLRALERAVEKLISALPEDDQW